MKKAAYFLLAALPFASMALAGSYTLQVDGMRCQYCANRLQGELQALEGVQSASVDLASKQVELDLADGQKLQEDQVRETLTDAGFTLVKVVEPDPRKDEHTGH